MIRTLLKPFSFLPAILLMYMIYNFSAQPAEISSQMSWKVTYKIVYTVDDVLDAGMADWEIETWAYRIHGFVRKLAHVTEYFALAIAVSFPLYVYGVRGIWLMLLAGLICVGFACGDEYHQSFVAGRSPSRRDIAIDSCGALAGIILVRIVGWTGRMTIFRPRKKKAYRAEDRRSNRRNREEFGSPEEYRYREESGRHEAYDRYDEYAGPEASPYPEAPVYEQQAPQKFEQHSDFADPYQQALDAFQQRTDQKNRQP